jgi:hypothetical protein
MNSGNDYWSSRAYEVLVICWHRRTTTWLPWITYGLIPCSLYKTARSSYRYIFLNAYRQSIDLVRYRSNRVSDSYSKMSMKDTIVYSSRLFRLVTFCVRVQISGTFHWHAHSVVMLDLKTAFPLVSHYSLTDLPRVYPIHFLFRSTMEFHWCCSLVMHDRFHCVYNESEA